MDLFGVVNTFSQRYFPNKVEIDLLTCNIKACKNKIVAKTKMTI